LPASDGQARPGRRSGVRAVEPRPDIAVFLALWYFAVVAIVGERPQSGVRIAIERPREGGPPWSYAGAAYLPDAGYPLRVTVSADGDVDVALSPSTAQDGATAAPPADLDDKVRLLVRAVYRQSQAANEPPARRIVRWRAPTAHK
jgi:hypothetical protein